MDLPQNTVDLTKVEKPAPLACSYGVPKLRPDFHRAPKIRSTSTLTIHYVDEAMLAGAPQKLPSFETRLHIKGDSLDLALSVNQVSIWRVNVTPNTIQESRHPLLDSQLSAKSLIRDLTFMYWPLDALSQTTTTICRDCQVQERGPHRVLTRAGYTLLDMTRHDNTLTLRNYPEGYTLTITDTASK